MIDLPPESTAPENASWSDFWSASNLDVFTDEIEKSTMKSANSSVIMSAKDTSQRSLVLVLLLVVPSCLWRRCRAMADYAAAFSALRAASALALGRRAAPAGRR